MGEHNRKPSLTNTFFMPPSIYFLAYFLTKKQVSVILILDFYEFHTIWKNWRITVQSWNVQMRTETMSNIHYWGLQERKAVVGVSDVNFIEWIRTEEASQS